MTRERNFFGIRYDSLIIVTAEVPVPCSAAIWVFPHLSHNEHIGRVFGISASSAGGPGFRHVPVRGILTSRLWFSPVFQSKCRNITSKCSRLFIHLFIYTMCRKMIIWSWIVKSVDGRSCSLCQNFPEETAGYYAQSGYSEANDYTWHC